MASQKSKFMIGVFVTIGLILMVVAIVWFGASPYFQKGNFFVTYFDESVQGLSLDSSVKYRGVTVGTVRAIQVAPDNKLIEVIMKIDMKGGDEEQLTAQLRAVGLTGIVYIELDRKAVADGDPSPQLGFPAQYPVIASRPSDMKAILSLVDRMVTEINKIDIQGIFQQIRGIAGGVEQLVGGPDMRSIISNLKSATAHLEHVVRQVDRLTANGQLEDVMKEARETIADTRRLIAKIDQDLDQMQLAGTVEKAREIVTGVDRSVKGVTRDLIATADNLQRASESLDILMDKLRDDPSDLLFSRPPPISKRER